VQWRIPIGFQLVPVGIMLCFLPFLKESPRWLATKHREDAALDNLAWIRKASPDDPDVQAEFAEIVAAIREEEHASKGSSWKEIFAKGNPIRFIIAFLIFTFQQVSERLHLLHRDLSSGEKLTSLCAVVRPEQYLLLCSNQ
jgi:hypothetical protein